MVSDSGKVQYYNVYRAFERSGRKVTLFKRVTLEVAQLNCRGAHTSSQTDTSAAGKARTRRHGPWFHCYTAVR